MDALQREQIIVPLITPPIPTDFFPLIDHVLAGGMQDLILFGTTGEGGKIDTSTKKAHLRTIVPFVANRAELYIGLICPTLDEAIDLTRFCYDLGIETALLPPHLYGQDTAAVVNTFLTRTSAKFILYNPPDVQPIGSVAYTFNPTRIVGLKDSSGDIALLKKLTVSPRPTPCRIYYGREQGLDQALQLSIDGIFSGTANIHPQLILQLWQTRSDALFKQLSQLKKRMKETCSNDYIQALKMALQHLGIIQF